MIKPSFIRFFLCLIVLEFIVLVSLILSYLEPKDKAISSLNDKIKANSESLIKSFSYNIMTKLNEVQKDLLSLKSYLSLVRNDNTNTPSCLVNSEEIKNIKFDEIIGDIQSLNRLNLNERLIPQHKKDSESKVIENYISNNQNFLDYIFYYKDKNENNLINEKSICYLKSLLKSFTIRNLLLSDESTINLDYYMLFYNNIVYYYPIEKLDLEYFKEQDDYKGYLKACNSNYNVKCFNMFDSNKETSQANRNNKINFYKSSIDKDGSFSQKGCINTKIDNQNTDFCINFQTQMPNLDIETYKTIDFFIVKPKLNDYQLLYYDKIANMLDNIKVYNSNDLYKYNIINSKEVSINLFHAMYYEIFHYFPDINNSDVKLGKVYTQYENIKEQINQAIYDINNQVDNINNLSMDTITISRNITLYCVNYITSLNSFECKYI